MAATLYGFSVSHQGFDLPIWFYHVESAKNFLRIRNLDWRIETASEDDVNPEDIADTETTVWTSEK